MVVFAVTKFVHGAWFVVIVIPSLVYVFFRIHHHYKAVAAALSKESSAPLRTYNVKTVILVDQVHAETIRMVNFAESLGDEWHAIHIAVNPERSADTAKKWVDRIGEDKKDKLIMVESPFRLLAEPVRDHLKSILDADPDAFVHVIMGHLVMNTYWEQALHQNSAVILNLALNRLDRIVVTQVPYRIQQQASHPENGDGNGNGVQAELNRAEGKQK
jgi:hypothetical protein